MSEPTGEGRRRAFNTALRIHIANVFKVESHVSLSLPALVVALGGATAIVYVAVRYSGHPSHKALEAPESTDATPIAQLRP